MEIKHLVLSGGGNTGFVFFGIIKTLVEKKILQLDKMQSIYGTSIGSIVGTCLALGFDMDTLESFLIKRPWNDLFKWDINHIFHCIEYGGLYSSEISTKILSPLLLAKDLSVDITLEEFYQWNKIDLHYFATEFMSMKICDISHTTHPQWKLKDAIYSSCCLPILFVPFCPNPEEVYIDGGILVNYPLDYCIAAGHSPQEILGLNFNAFHTNRKTLETNPFLNHSPYRLIDLFYSFVFKLWYNIRIPTKNTILNEIQVECEDVNIHGILKVFESQEKRIQLVESGMQQAVTFLQSKIIKPYHQ